VVVVDVAKGFVPTWLFADLAGVGLGWTLLFGTAAILGHMFSFWVVFRGGKGVATSAGVFVALAPLAVLGCFGVWLLVTLTTRYVSVGSIAAAVALPALVAWTRPAGDGGALLIFSTALAAFVIWKHRSNIRRLLAGEENRFGRAGGPDPSGAPQDGDMAGAPAPESAPTEDRP
jgi:glycerol-3-phosphate acyltransferase PlsY